MTRALVSVEFEEGYYVQPRVFHPYIAWGSPSSLLTSHVASASEFPPDLDAGLEKRSGTELRPIGRFDIDRISVKIKTGVHSGPRARSAVARKFSRVAPCSPLLKP
ncbi:hypothetical protein BS47DRAFT_1353843 [Hydnum rufescens UP504]|uniref:Uncharacterized protein n=1 Tax=Hydnum rufescens UP504 TaxID=1448309 RepID=A0A9P6AHR1_9AGAM|nr:hypothetical protein BS47DRAFT_1353843 [Hydnum rufescens UP504]